MNSDHSREIVKYYKLAPKNIALLQFILEGYDGLCTMSTVDSKRGLIKIAIPKTQEKDFKKIIKLLSRKLNLKSSDFDQTKLI